MPKHADVDAWFADSEHPLKAAMMRVREIILDADPAMEECIKWKTPTFTFGGNLASFNPRAKAHVSLLFHTGARISGEHPRLEGGGNTARYMKITDPEACKADLERVVKSWIADKSAAKKKTR